MNPTIGVTPATPCDEWEGGLSLGYGTLKQHGVNIGTHRIVMMQEVGHLERWEFVCHRCDNRKCIRLDHLFVASHEDNARDMCAKGRQHQQTKTHCPSGHEYTKENTAVLLRNGTEDQWYRKCRTCDSARALKRYYKNRDIRLVQMRANRNKQQLLKEQTN